MRLDPLPLCLHFICISKAYIAKDMGMTSDHFGDDPIEYITTGEVIVLGKHGDQHGEDKKNITDFFADFLLAALINCLRQFLAFL